MGWIFLVGLVAWPILEIATFVWVGEWIGWINTILLFLGAGVAGVWLLRAEGLSLLLRARTQMRDGVAPVDEAFDALCLVVGALLLILPGFLTDIAALLLFLPITRRALRQLVVRAAARQQTMRAGRVTIIEGEFEEVRPEMRDPARNPNAKTIAGDVVRERD